MTFFSFPTPIQQYWPPRVAVRYPPVVPVVLVVVVLFDPPAAAAAAPITEGPFKLLTIGVIPLTLDKAVPTLCAYAVVAKVPRIVPTSKALFMWLMIRLLFPSAR